MLTPETWAALCEGADFTALVNALKETVYGPYLTTVEDKDLTPRRALYQIRSHLADAYVAVISMVPEPAQPPTLPAASTTPIGFGTSSATRPSISWRTAISGTTPFTLMICQWWIRLSPK